MLKNYLDDVCCPDRIPCHLDNNILVGELGGGDHFNYNPSTGLIDWHIRHGVNETIDRDVDVDILDKIITKLLRPKEEVETEVVKTKYGIKSKRLNAKLLKEMSRYEHVKNTGSW